MVGVQVEALSSSQNNEPVTTTQAVATLTPRRDCCSSVSYSTELKAKQWKAIYLHLLQWWKVTRYYIYTITALMYNLHN